MQGRDPSKLLVFPKAHALVVQVYKLTALFPSDERFGLVSQMRRAAVSIPCNIVEGCTRKSLRDYMRFLEIAHGSCEELRYQLKLAGDLGFVGVTDNDIQAATEVSKMLSGLLSSLALSLQPSA